jgi:two-component system, NtrC family, response regulator HydG
LRSDHPFIQADLGAMTESIFESELFGYKRGAFTDAKEDRSGRFAMANGGTLFLDEIANINITQQFKLLTALQDRKITRLGSTEYLPIDIRLISATNADIYAMSNGNLFRKDLIYRLNTIEITIPPLRQRIDDIGSLTKHFIDLYATKYNKEGIEISKQALSKLVKYQFPGNIRELQHVIERAVIMTDSDIIQESEITFSTIENKQAESYLKETTLNLNSLEKKAIEKVIEKHQGNITKAAQELGLTRSSLYRRLGKYDL